MVHRGSWGLFRLRCPVGIRLVFERNERGGGLRTRVSQTKPSPSAKASDPPKGRVTETIANESPPISGRVNLQLQPFKLCVTAMIAHDFSGLKHVGVLR